MFHWMLMYMCLPKFDIYQRTVAPNCFKSHKTRKKKLSDDRSKIHFVRRNIISTRQSVWALKKIIFRLVALPGTWTLHLGTSTPSFSRKAKILFTIHCTKNEVFH